MIAKGIKEEEIAFIHSYKKDDDKVNLFKKVNSGDIRVLLGSSQKMGAGMNVQERLFGLHHMDAPWRPTDLEQREGRIIRHGNKLVQKYGDKFNVSINRYSTKYTYDTRLWQILENKAKFINEFKKGNIQIRSGEDIGNSEVQNVEEMKAIARGNPYLLLHMKLESEYRKKNNILSRENGNRKLMTISIKEYEEGSHKRYNYLKETIDNYNNLYNNNSYIFKLQEINERYVMYEENTGIELYKDELQPSEIQIKNRKEKFPSIIKEKIEELSLEKTKITQDINLSKEMLKKSVDDVDVKTLKEDLEKCKEVLNKMNLISEATDFNKSDLYYKVKSKDFDKEMTDIDKFFSKKQPKKVINQKSVEI